MATYATRLSSLSRLLPLVCCGWLLAAPIPCHAKDPAAAAANAEPIDLVMFQDPRLEIAKARLAFPAGLKELWLKAMARPDSELKRLAADSFALAHQRGIQDLEDTHSHLAALLKAPQQDLGVQRAAVHALIELDAREYAELLAATAQSLGLTTALMVEPALARWKSGIMRDTWLSRIDDPRAGLAARHLAIEGLGDISESQAANSLKRIATDARLTIPERMAAARALSRMQAPGLVGVAGSLVAGSLVESSPGDTPSQTTLFNPVLALELLQREDSPDAIALLRQLTAHVSTAVQSGALQRLYAIDPKHVYDFVETAIVSRDAGVRTVGAEGLIVQKEVKWIAPLATLLDDVNPTLRRRVAKALVQLAGETALHDEVIKQASTVLQGNAWRGIEQATVVLVLLDHKPAGARLVELLQHARPEIKIASAWGLRRLAVPEHLPAMLAQAQSLHTAFLAGNLPFDNPGSEAQTTQLFMAFGQMRYGEAEPLMMRYVPKDHTLGVHSRAAAVWSLGLLKEGQALPELTATLLARLADMFSLQPEADDVRRMCAISIGRMKSTSAVDALRKNVAGDGGYPARATYWALEQLTGEAPPPVGEFQVNFADWFLVPAN